VSYQPLIEHTDTEPPKSASRLSFRALSVKSRPLVFLPRGFAQMAVIDLEDFNRQTYRFEYVHREFLGEVRCLVFDVTPQQKSGKGRFLGRIWVEDQDFNIVRFNGAYNGNGHSSWWFHFDSWRTNVQPGLWMPSFVYSEEKDMHYNLTKKLDFKAQTRLWGYNLGHASQEQELSKILVESAVTDDTKTANDLSPVQAQRTWDHQAEDNVIDRLERIGLVAPKGEVDKILETVVNNLEVTNNLDVVGTLTAQDLGLDGDLIAAGDVTADNLKVGIVNPTVPGKPGDLYRNTATGSLWLYEGGTWKQLATTPIPAGFTMMGFVTTAPQGWLLVDGSRVTRAAAGGLWDALPAWRTVVGGAEYIQLPDAKDCFFGWGAPGVKGGNPSSSVVISTANMPAHRHLTSPSGQMVGAGAHGHGATLLPNGGHTHVTQPNQGSHGHDLDDPGHFHGAFEGGSGFVAAVWGAPNKLDGLFNDASHTWNVDVIPWTFPAKTGIRTMASDAANHTHSTDNPGNHFHSLSIDQQGTNHTHIINEVTVGSGAPLDIRPPFMGVYLYVKI
jgi:hypothetical protein